VKSEISLLSPLWCLRERNGFRSRTRQLFPASEGVDKGRKRAIMNQSKRGERINALEIPGEREGVIEL
jgi:hypothetical protein